MAGVDSSSPPPLERLEALVDRALVEARAAIDHHDVPIAALIVRRPDLTVIASRHNERELLHDATAHAEVLALRDAARAAGSWRLDGHFVVTTLEPCVMCAGAAWAAQLDGIVFGAADPKAGASGSLYSFATDPRLNHEAWVVAGVRETECGDLLRAFFSERR